MRYCGREFTKEEISWVRQLIADRSDISRKDISVLFCQEFNWLKPDGGLKDMSCRVAMLKMETDMPSASSNKRPRVTLRAVCNVAEITEQTLHKKEHSLLKQDVREWIVKLSSETVQHTPNLKKNAAKRLKDANKQLNTIAAELWYGLNGLDFETGDSWKQIEGGDYSSWAAGLQLRLPLQGGIESRSKLRKSELEKRRQLMVLKDIEIELKNRIDTAIDNVASTTEQLHYAEQIIDIQKRLFDAELAKLQAGQSSSRLVLEKEDNYRSARETALVNTVKCQRALVEMELASGAILKKYGVDIMETEL